NASGTPLSGITVEFTVAAGGGQVTGGTPLTDASGVARVGSWVLGTSGQQRLTARVGTLSVVTFEAEITPEAAETFTAGGGTLTIDELGHPYDGLSLTVPAGAFPEGSDWSIRVDETAPPVSLPAGFTVAGPTLDIRTSAARAASLL